MENGVDADECLPDASTGREIADDPPRPCLPAEHTNLLSVVP
jgi:hypothetical protein